MMQALSLPELLAPAGSEDCLHAAIQQGADAVYFGLAGSENAVHPFNARVRAPNIPIDKLGGIMDLLRRRNVKGYVTLNTLVRNDEFPEVERLLRLVDEAGVDAILVQDFGLARLARQICPGLPLHASTQMSLTSLRALETAATLGIERVVLPRELSLRQIADLRASTSLELEMFVHGALCVSFSGQCYASLGLGGIEADRSANRGRCAQPCRMPYTLMDARRSAPIPGLETPRQLLSPCDLTALPLLPDILRAGVHSLKIEGRLKPPEYVAEVTRIYRNALDRLAESPGTDGSPSPIDVEDDLRRLELTFSRGFSTGWLEGVSPCRLVPGTIAAHRGAALGTVIEMRRDAVVVKLSAPVRRGDGVLFENEADPEHSQGGRVYEIFRKGASVPDAPTGSRVLLTFANHSIDADQVHPGQAVRKTDDPRLQKEIRRSLKSCRPARRIPLQIRVYAAVGEPIRIEVHRNGTPAFELRGETELEQARKHPITLETLREQFDRLGETIYRLDHLEATFTGEPMIPLSVLGGFRREMIQRLDSLPLHEKRSPLPKPDYNEKPGSLESETSETGSACEPVLHLLLRDLRLFEDPASIRRVIKAGCRSFYAEFAQLSDYPTAADHVRRAGAEFVAVLPRILKPDESGFLEQIARLQPDAVLARNLEELAFFRDREILVIADFSLNAINDLSARQLLDWGAHRVTPGPDLRVGTCLSLPEEKLERIVYGRLPLFTMEHCLWRANLVEGDKPCDRLCRSQPLEIRDRRGAFHPVRPDPFCRNIIDSSERLVLSDLSGAGKHRRIEWGDSSEIEALETIIRRFR